jgi:2-methylisocitrate lyase-like PEP mutase family enzyme
MLSIPEKRAAFRKLHVSGCFVIPHPWDVGTAKYLAHIGYKALATTSAGFAFSQGRADGHVSRDMVLAHMRELADATDLPVNADFEAGFGKDATEVAESIALGIETGVAGISVEDATGHKAKPLYDLDEAVARIRAARGAIDKSKADVMLIGRAEGFLVGRPDLDEVIARLKAYSGAGADCLYAPALKTREQIAAVVKAVAPKPINLLIAWNSDLTVKDIAALGVRRISIGSGFARVAWAAFMRGAKDVAENGSFDCFADAAKTPELNGLFGK